MTCMSNCGGYVVPLAAAAAFTLVLVLPCRVQGGSVYGSIELSAVGDSTAGAVFLGIGKRDLTGHSVSSAGDFNGDGIEDLMIAAPWADWEANQRAGQVYLIYGQKGERPLSGEVDLATVGTTTAGVTFTGTGWFGYAGHSVSSAGDVNGDGLDDLVIGAPGLYSAGPRQGIGRAYLVYGESGLGGTVDLATVGDATYGAIFEGAETADGAGYAVSSAGDINGDGLADLLVSAAGSGSVGEAADKAYLIYGQRGRNEYYGTINLATVGSQTPGVLFTGLIATYNSSFFLSSAGDVNGDGLDDFLLGGFWADANGVGMAGETYLVYGQSDPAVLSGTIDVSTVGGAVAGAVFMGTDRGDNSGFSVSSAGDVNGDGFDDLLIGAPGRGQGGAAYLVYGAAADKALAGRIGLSSIDTSLAGASFGGLDFGDMLAHIVSSAGDINGDGLNDVLIGAPAADAPSKRDAGATYLIYGQSGDDALSGRVGLDTLGRETPGAVFHGSQFKDSSGVAGAAGDFNGDGLDDLLIGATQLYADVDTGRVYLIYGQPPPTVFALASVASGDWNAAATWDDGTEVPLSFMDIEVGAHTVVVAEDGAAATLVIGEADGQVIVRPEKTLRLFESVDLAAGKLTLEFDALLDVRGDVYFGDQAVYQNQLRGPWYGQIDADGDVSLGGRLDLEAIGSISQPGDHQRTIVRAEGALTGDFSITPSPGQHLGNGIFYEGLVHLDGEEGEASTIDVQVFQAAAGDTNGDRQIDNGDLQRILGSNSFDRPGDWDWPQGDFNGDRQVDNRDLQRILATGYFGTGPYAAVSPSATIQVPEPPTLLLALTAGTLGLLLWRRRAGALRARF